jgi:hypothetical protein
VLKTRERKYKAKNCLSLGEFFLRQNRSKCFSLPAAGRQFFISLDFFGTFFIKKKSTSAF